MPLARRHGIHLGLNGIEQPGSTQQLLIARLENLKAEHIDWNIPFAEVLNDALTAGIQLSGNDDQLVTFVQLIVIQLTTETRQKIYIQTASRLEALVDRC